MFKRILFALVVFLLTTLSLSAGTYNPENIPIPENSSTNPNYISNPDSILSDSICELVNQRLFHLEDSLGVKSLVIVVEHIEGDDPFEFSLQVGNKYGIGSKEDDNGVIITLATLDRSYQILTGNGMEATLPDITCQKIGDYVMKPSLKEGNWGKAIDDGVQAVCGTIYKEEYVMKHYGLYEPTLWESLKDSFSEYFWGWMILLFFIRLIVNIIVNDFLDHKEYKFNMPAVFRWLATLASYLIWNPRFSVYHKPPKQQRIYYIDNRYKSSGGGHSGGGGYSGGGSSYSGSSSSSSSKSYGSRGGGHFSGGGAGGRF